MDVKEVDILGESINSHWYYLSKAKAIMHYLKPCNLGEYKILDVGAGSGFFSRYLLTNTHASEAYCVDLGYTQEENEEFLSKNLYRRITINNIEVDLVLLMDVLEHVDYDKALLDDYVSKVPVGTYFLITVPAFNFLWSSHDDFLEHRRRYTLSSLKNVVLDSGLKIERISYYFGIVFPIACLLRLINKFLRKIDDKPRSQLTKHSNIINLILKFLCILELPFMKKNKIAGLSVFCLAIKV